MGSVNIDKKYHKSRSQYDTRTGKEDVKGKPELPKLPRGQGSMTWCREATIMYRKYVDTGSEKIQVAVYGKTPNEVLKLMRLKEIELTQKYIKDEAKTLEVALREWMETRALSMKKSSYDRIETTFKNQICGYPIAQIRFQQISEVDINNHLETLIRRDKRSWSTVKKCYDLLNGFFKQAVHRKRLRDNPIEFVKMPAQGQMETKTKDISFFYILICF